jgi:oligopeptide transport system substrate-binding protein
LGVSVVGAQDDIKVLNWNWSTEPPSLDPSIATDTTSHQIIAEIFPSLTRLHEETGELDPGMATWEVDESGTVYTFTIMEGIPWVHYNAETGAVEEVTDADGNVRYVTANDFAYGALRTLDPNTGGDYAYVLAYAVAGGEAYNGADPEADDMEALKAAVGIEVVDEYTLKITTPYKAAFMANILGMWMAAAQPSWLIEEVGDFWTEPENIQSYGPYALKEWYHDDSLTIIKNPLWAGTDAIPAPVIDEIYGVMLTDASAAFANYEAGTLDVVAAPLSEMDRIKADPVLSEELNIAPDFCTYYYGFNVTKEPMDNVHMRRAFAYAVDRQGLIDNVTKGGQEPAQWFSRPGLVASPTMETNPDLGIGYDPDMAQEELALALEDMGLESVDELPPITLMHNESEGHARIAEAIQQMWAEELGIDVQIATQEWKVYLDSLKEDPPHIYRMGWCQDYPDAHNFVYDVWGDGGSGTLRSRWNNTELGYPKEEFQSIIEEAMVLDDQEARRELYAQAEQILNYEDPAMISIYWYTSVAMTKPYVERTYSLYGSEAFEKWDLAEK